MKSTKKTEKTLHIVSFKKIDKSVQTNWKIDFLNEAFHSVQEANAFITEVNSGKRNKGKIEFSSAKLIA